MQQTRKVLVTGGAGYIGGVLVPKLIRDGHDVTVLDRLFFGRRSIEPFVGHPRFTIMEGDIRDEQAVAGLLEEGFDAVVHLAAIANDPCSDLDPDLTRSVNRIAVEKLMRRAKAAGVNRFLYASSASVYGISDEPEVHEDLPRAPITLYARYKSEGEEILNELSDRDFCGVSVRAATVCGVSPRLRLDLTINILTYHAVCRGAIRVFGGRQMRPNIHIDDLTELYRSLLSVDADRVRGRAFNVSTQNATVMELAEMIRDQIDPALPIDVEPSQDQRSYRLSTRRPRPSWGFGLAGRSRKRSPTCETYCVVAVRPTPQAPSTVTSST